MGHSYAFLGTYRLAATSQIARILQGSWSCVADERRGYTVRKCRGGAPARCMSKIEGIQLNARTVQQKRAHTARSNPSGVDAARRRFSKPMRGAGERFSKAGEDKPR